MELEEIQILRIRQSHISAKFGEPVGGRVLPSRSEGNRLETEEGCWKQIIVAFAPVSMAFRSIAQASAPTKLFPEKILTEL